MITDGVRSRLAGVHAGYDDAHLSLQPRITTYLGIFFVALATLMYEILLTRIFSVTMLYHFAFVALSVAMFGLTAGALLVYLAPHLVHTGSTPQRLALVAVALPVAIVASFLIDANTVSREHVVS